MLRVGIALITALTLACGSVTSTDRSSRTVNVTVTVSGVPNGRSVEIWQTHPATGGGYIHETQLGTTTTSLDVTVPVGSFVESSPIVGSYESWMPDARFQQVKQDTRTLAFAYQHEFSVTISMWSHGGDASTFDRVMGTVSPSSGWFREGETVTFTATPAAGFRFAHWGLFDDGAAIDEKRDSGTSPTFTITVKKDFSLVAGFVPAGTP